MFVFTLRRLGKSHQRECHGMLSCTLSPDSGDSFLRSAQGFLVTRTFIKKMGGQPVAVRINQFCIFAIVRLEKLVRYTHPSFPDWKVAVKRSAHDPLFPREANRDS